MTEEELAKQIVEYLNESHWDVYQEVPFNDGIADIVAAQGGRLWVIECKRNLGFAVIGQALRWKPYAHYVSIASEDKRTRNDQVAREILGKFGIGWLVGGRGWSRDKWPTEMMKAALCRTISAKLKDTLRPEHKSFAAAGSSYGTRFTPFQETALAILRYVESNPGMTMRTVLESVKTHYTSTASAISNVRKWIEAGVIKGVKLHKKGKYLFVYPSDFVIPETADNSSEQMRLANE